MNKEALKKNAFWIGLAAGAAAIVAFFFLVVWSAMALCDKASADLKTHAKEINKKISNPEIPSDVQLKAYNAHLDELKQELDAPAGCKGYYKTYDDVLEAWMQGLQPSPDVGTFRSRYDSAAEQMDKDLEAAGILRGIQVAANPFGGASGPVKGGFNWEDLSKPVSNLRDVQKKYWIRERVKNVLLKLQGESPKCVEALEEVRFPDTPFPPQAGQGEDYIGWPAGVKEFELKGGYGTVITTGVRALIQNPQAPRFLQMLLESDTIAPKMLVHLRGVRVAMTEHMEELFQKDIPFKPGENGPQMAAEEQKKLEAEVNKPKSVRVFVTLEVFDFDGKKLETPYQPPE